LGGRSAFFQLPAEGTATHAAMCIENRQNECDYEEYPGQPSREFHQNIGRLSTEQVFSDRAPKCRAKSFALWALHQNDQHHQQCHQHPEAQQNGNQNRHRDREYGERRGGSKRGAGGKRRTLNAEHRTPNGREGAFKQTLNAQRPTLNGRGECALLFVLVISI
jgi:hypothetical protein